MKSVDVIAQLTKWYSNQCDGDWEHEFGIKISTLDNPGWWVCVDVGEVSTLSLPFEDVEVERSPSDWVHCKQKIGTVFGSPDTAYAHLAGFCGPRNLDELLRLMLEYVQQVRPSPNCW